MADETTGLLTAAERAALVRLIDPQRLGVAADDAVVLWGSGGLSERVGTDVWHNHASVLLWADDRARALLAAAEARGREDTELIDAIVRRGIVVRPMGGGFAWEDDHVDDGKRHPSWRDAARAALAHTWDDATTPPATGAMEGARPPASASELRAYGDGIADALAARDALAESGPIPESFIEQCIDAYAKLRYSEATGYFTAAEHFAADPEGYVKPATRATEGEYTLGDQVARFADAVREKLAAAERKYGWRDAWRTTDAGELRADLRRHIEKGDPRDVAAYCLFLWARGESTADPQVTPPATGATEGATLQPIATAPRDGTYILLAGPSGYVGTPLRFEAGRFSSYYANPGERYGWRNHANDAFTDGGEAPTHWCPLPAAAREGAG